MGELILIWSIYTGSPRQGASWQAMSTKGAQTFRFAGKKMLLTYSQYEANKENLHMFLNMKLKQECKVKIAHEHHQDGNIHTHACVECQKKIDIKNPNFLDFEGVHPNIKPPSSLEHWRNQVKYMDKEDADVYGDICVAKTKDEEWTEALEYVKQCKTRKQLYGMSPYLKTISSKVTFFENFWKTQHQKRVTTPLFKMDQFNLQPITDWSTSWLVFGQAGSGKTNWALAHFSKPLLVSHIEDLQELDEEEHDGIVFDDLSFRHLPGQAIIHLLDHEFERSIHNRFFNATIPAKTKKIFCHNDDNIFEPEKEISMEQRRGIQRRYQVIHVTCDLRVQTSL